MQWLWLTFVAVDADAEEIILRRDKVHFREVMSHKICSDGRGHVWWISVSRPKHGGRMLAQLRQRVDGVKDVSITDVAKDATGQDDVGRDRSLIHRNPRRVSLYDLDLAEAGPSCPLTDGCYIPLVEFDQAGPYMLSVRIGCQRLNHIKSLARVQTDDLKRSIEFCIEFCREGLSESSLDRR